MHLNTRGWRKWPAVLAVLAVICGAFAQDQSDFNARLSNVQAHLETISKSGNGTIKVYYDFEEKNRLKGGKVTIQAPSAAPLSLAETTPLYNAYTLTDNGPCENRIDIVFVGDGYTADQMDLYLTHITNILAQFFNETPLSEYASYFNVHIVEVISNQSGVDEPALGIYRDTALDMAFDCDGIARLLCVDYTKAWNAAANAPAADLVIAIANTTRYGGAGYPNLDLATLAGGNSSAVEIALHEFGHSFADLADEYDYGGTPQYTGGEPLEANVSIHDAAAQLASQLKWYRWLDLPEVDTFEGANYSLYGIYRPTSNSKMKVLGYPFGPVNTEQFVFSIYEAVSSIDASSPATAAAVPSEQIFSVTCQTPVSHALNIEWQIDAVAVFGANQASFCPDAYLTANTIHTLTARVTDGTALVRDENKRVSLLTYEKSWQVWKASADFNADGTVNLADLANMLPWWLSDNQDYDIAPPGGDAIVNFYDFAVLARQWQTN